MKTNRQKFLNVPVILLLTGATFFIPGRCFAHCDTLDGPVVITARAALEKGMVTPLLKWVRAEDEEAIRQAFQKTLAVRAKGPEARELADHYFFETLVRLHRAGEGMPFTGLKPGTEVDPAVAMADRALADGKVVPLVDLLTKEVAEGLRHRFARVVETKKHADDSVAAGREYVEAYVAFTHYAEGLHGLSAVGHGHGAGAETTPVGGHHGAEGGGR